jgi:hypothetical protein
MDTYADLEIDIHRRDSTHYSVELRFNNPRSDVINRFASTLPTMQFDDDALRVREVAPDAYGSTLTAQLLADQDVRSRINEAIAVAEADDLFLRFKLFLGPSASELHTFRWETLMHPQRPDPLLLNERVLFSRFLSGDWRTVKLRARTALRALVVIANPSDLNEYAPDGNVLAPVDVAGETARVEAIFNQDPAIPTTILASDGQASTTKIIEHLREEYDILYLVAHGAVIRNQARIWLEKEDGTADVVAGSDLVTRMGRLQCLPRLVVLASCQSAGSGETAHSTDHGALSSLGPSLAEAGIPAVVAMQGNISMETVALFMPEFFKQLQRDGQIDRAMAVAREYVYAKERLDWWIPVLFLRLRQGRIWYVPGFGDEGEDFEKWPALLRNIERGNCTPILSAHLTDLLDSPEEIARQWAEYYNFPLASHECNDIVQVAQYLSISQDFQFPREELLETLRHKILDNYEALIPAELQNAELEELFSAVGRIQRAQNPANPYKVLANLPFTIYITANISNMLKEALIEVGKEPQIEICRWNEDLEMFPSVYDDNPSYQPSVERPLVYHIFGISEEPESVVLTEDDYFDFLMGIAANKELIPIAVREAIADTGLIFLGFQLYDWSFRLLFRSLISQSRRSRHKRFTNVVGQIAPDDSRTLEPERAREYMKRYFQDADMDVFWGTVEDFTRVLVEQQEAIASRGGSRDRSRDRRGRMR